MNGLESHRHVFVSPCGYKKNQQKLTNLSNYSLQLLNVQHMMLPSMERLYSLDTPLMQWLTTVALMATSWLVCNTGHVDMMECGVERNLLAYVSCSIILYSYTHRSLKYTKLNQLLLQYQSVQNLLNWNMVW